MFDEIKQEKTGLCYLCNLNNFVTLSSRLVASHLRKPLFVGPE